jgi:galactokinase
MDLSLVNKIKNSYKAEFGEDPILVFSPGRINLIGEHVDYNDGLVFPAAIDKGIVLAIQKIKDTSESKSTAIANDFEESFHFELSGLVPLENGGWRNYLIGIVAELEKLGCTIEPFNILFGGNVPAGAGLSSSAALENAVVFGLNNLFDLQLSKKQMILISQKSEHEYVGVKCGIMDQYASMFGEENHFLLLDTRSLKSKAFHIDLSGYELTLINSNVQHNLSDSTYNKRRTLCENISKMLDKQALRDVSITELETIKEQVSEEDYQKVLYVIEEIERTKKAGEVIEKNDITALGKLLFQTHKGLSRQYEVSCDELDFLVELARNSKAVLGARMMGGGFGGCTINIIKKNEINNFLTQTKEAYKEKFGYDCTVIKVKLSKGTQLINEVNESTGILS